MYADFIHFCYPIFALLIGESCSADSEGVDILFIFLIFISIVFIHFLDGCYTCVWSVLGFVRLSKPLSTLWLIEGFLLVLLTEGLLLEA
jgi:uncharacterized membrane protein